MTRRSRHSIGGTSKAHLFWPATVFIVALDVVTKYLAHTLLLPAHLPREMVGDGVRLTLTYNPGAAFGLHLGPASRWIFFALTVGALFFSGRLYRHTRPNDRVRALALGLICGGAFGNLINRIWSARGVVDFIDVGVGDWRWPTFNVADVGVSVGAFLLASVLWGEDRREAAARATAEERS